MMKQADRTSFNVEKMVAFRDSQRGSKSKGVYRIHRRSSSSSEKVEEFASWASASDVG
jgi:hypothetical protein